MTYLILFLVCCFRTTFLPGLYHNSTKDISFTTVEMTKHNNIVLPSPPPLLYKVLGEFHAVFNGEKDIWALDFSHRVAGMCSRQLDRNLYHGPGFSHSFIPCMATISVVKCDCQS